MQHNFDTDELDITYTSFQSGRQLELKHAVHPNSDNVAMIGTFLLSIGTRCCEYSACVTRTVMVNPIRAHKEAYALALEVQRLIVQLLVPGAVFKDVYSAAKKKVQEIKPELVGRFPKNVGFAMGLEFKDTRAYISATSARQVKAGSVFTIGTGFEKAAVPGSGDPWAVWITDTVLVPAECSTNEVLTSGSSSRVDAVMFELMRAPGCSRAAEGEKGASADADGKAQQGSDGDQRNDARDQVQAWCPQGELEAEQGGRKQQARQRLAAAEGASAGAEHQELGRVRPCP
ncbi:unnamed protein product [Polarella glacialis]|uniref:FACT complex subunit n=1 Tax=Polarella glacialis TaxID=89957 RepID=A0A813EL84_POLGL|nr:unnamed protein product [Polarella glacialis]